MPENKEKGLYGMNITHIALKVSDIDRSLAFYTGGLGFRLFRRWENNGAPAALIDLGGGFLELFGGAPAGEAAPAAGTYPHFALAADDVRKAFDLAISAGAKAKRPPSRLVLASEPPTPIEIAFVTGPDGETIEFFAFRGEGSH